ncbi:hypothetical protein BU24DRAFT_179619 [Aaosphaeria arxii CBS 175.79]|uniref:DUF4336 domain-containing protein n=1 Tax=Aaosphaeria arxii CBS 175.79 TaxID=1450172 RepID=A0A6A5XRH0_9PLEO|nr:uncharacterized protein BU24DRAFT_179619 [Aaosphaeria arxii CBS 175.79]KAF2015499.1 hypothetical protein BU24DRAFT_179619 [Aaosphaeria arxii CBS 175.79]
MASKLVPSDPAKVMVIRDVVPKTIVTFSTPFWRFGKLKIGGRGTVVRLQSGSLAVFSPVALTDDVKQRVSELGEVKYIAALDIEHHIFLGPWHTAYPTAQIIGPEGLPEKRKNQGDQDVPFAHVFTADKPLPSISPEFDAEFEYAYVPEHSNKEIVFNHKPTKTLIEADLLFNYPSTEQFSKTGASPTSGILTKLFGAFTNTQGLGQSRLLWYSQGAEKRPRFAQRMAAIDKWDFERLIPCHGDVIEGNAKSVFRHVMGWHLELAKKST